MPSPICLLAAALSLPVAATLTCVSNGVSGTSCDAPGSSDVCYHSGGDSGCIPTSYVNSIDISDAACNEVLCWCLTDNCNTNAWYTTFRQTYVPPPQCYTGIGGANEGPKCEQTQLYRDMEYEKPDCYSRGLKNMCIENNQHMGQGDGCSDHSDQNACEGDLRFRDTTNSYDGTSQYCRWLPEMTKNQTRDNCEIDDGCKYYPDRGHCEMQGSESVCEGNCESSEMANNNEIAWHTQRGQDCEQRSKYGCFENNDHMGESSRCTDHQNEQACVAYIGDESNHCWEGVCSGISTDTTPCAEKTNEGWCAPADGSSGCTWKKQCCQWIPMPMNPEYTCLNSGKGTLDGVCQYNDGNGPPSQQLIADSFEQGLFMKKDRYVNRCGMIVSFRNGFGSAAAIGSDKKELLAAACLSSGPWKDVAEHTGHTSDTIDEYCTNFVPETSTMSAFSQHSPGYIIQKAKEGQFGAIFPGLQHLLYIVIARPELGECLFSAETGKWGFGVCTCEGEGCNNQTALEFLVDRQRGPMRLLQFIDGSLSDLIDEVNSVANGLLDAEGRINSSLVSQVTEVHIDDIVQFEGVSNRTNKDELWGIVQDYQALLAAEAIYKQRLMDHHAFKPLRTQRNKVAQANAAAGCQLYGEDGVPNTVCLQGLSSVKVDAVSDATGIAAADITLGVLTSAQLEMGIPLAALTTTSGTTTTTTITTTTTTRTTTTTTTATTTTTTITTTTTTTITTTTTTTTVTAAFKCEASTRQCEDCEDREAVCDKPGFSNLCFYSRGGEYGCVPTMFIPFIRSSETGCNDDVCWCLTDRCNTKEWYTAFRKKYVPPPQCFTGIAGSNEGPQCEKSQLYTDMEYKTPDCYSRGVNNRCIENTRGMGMGDGCSDYYDQNACERDSRSRDSTESYDGTSNYCRWLPQMSNNQTRDHCEIDDGCKYYPDRGHCEMQGSEWVCDGNCESSDIANSRENSWIAQRGQDCQYRTKYGCFENNDHMGESSRCTDHQNEPACITYIGDEFNDCWEGICSGSSTDTTPCAEKTYEGWCASGDGSTSCTWKKQCCQWVPKPIDLEGRCLNSGRGTLDGVCQFNDGEGPPNKQFIANGFEYGLFQKNDLYVHRCAMVASFRTGFGSAAALGSDKKGLVNCNATGRWKGFADVTGHSSDTIDEYCTNFVPEASAMSALTQHTPGYIIEKVKQGQFGAVFPGLRHLLYIVTARPEFGECLFSAETGQWGFGVCTCQSEGCNNQTAIEFIVDRERGPMRLLQFIDGSLSDLTDDINSVVHGLMDSEARINSSAVSQVTEANVDAMLQFDGVSKKTNKNELWGIVQDYQLLLTAEAAYKQTLKHHYAFKPLVIKRNKVAQANMAAGCQLYGDDGVPSTVCLQSLSSVEINLVSDATGIAAADLTVGKVTSDMLEKGIPLASITTTTTTTTTVTTTTTTTTTSTTSTTTVTTTKPELAIVDVRITGEMTLEVPDSDAFMNDEAAKNAVKDGIAEHVGVSPNQVVLSFAKGELDQRRLGGQRKVRKLANTLIGNDLKVTYTITLSAQQGISKQKDVEQKIAASTTESTALNNAIATKITEAKGDDAAEFAVTVSSMTPITVSKEAAHFEYVSDAAVSMLSPLALIIVALGPQIQ